MLYSVKMRSNKGSLHGVGGKHISGAERIVEENDMETSVIEMLHRAAEHERGKADFINMKVEAVKPGDIQYRQMLPLSACSASNEQEGHEAAFRELVRAGVSEKAARAGIKAIKALPDSMRGAMLMDAQSGVRLDHLGMRGVRCSNMDCDNSGEYEQKLRDRGLVGDHVREALVLASKVASAPGVAAELCWSDDPMYVTGYVGSSRFGYRRIPVMKERGNPIGGRVFYLMPDTDLGSLIDYMENQVVLIRL